jgi:hypothetical protein
MIYHLQNCEDLPVKQAKLNPKKAKDEIKPFCTNFGTVQRALCFRKLSTHQLSTFSRTHCLVCASVHISPLSNDLCN